MTDTEIRASLDQLVAAARLRLRRFAQREAFQESLGLTFYAFSVVPVVYLLVSAIAMTTGIQVWQPSWLQLIYLPVAFTGLVVLMTTALKYLQSRPDKQLALALFDRQLNLKDSLQIADEFLDVPNRTAFQEAALDQAVSRINEAKQHDLSPIQLIKPNFDGLKAKEGLISCTLLVLAVLVHFITPGEILADSTPVVAKIETGPAADSNSSESETDSEEETEALREQQLSEEMLAFVTSTKAKPTDSQQSPLTQNDQRSQSPQVSTAAETANQGAQSSTSQQSSGFKSEQKDLPESRPNQKSKPRSPEKKPTARKPPTENENSENQMSGMSKSGSSNKVSTSSMSDSDYKTKDNPDLEEVELEADDEEDEEQEAGASSKPMLEQRKAPADRQLSPSGAGQEQENPDANGRSGAGGLKKTRGVAAKLLGVPMPDQLTGHNNPGRVKINRKNANPNLQAQEPGATSPHGELDQSIGSVPDAQMSVWMRQLIQTYFTQKRTS